MELWSKTEKILIKVLGYLAAVSFLCMAFCVLLGILARYFNFSVVWTEEMSRCFLVWFVFIASPTGLQYIEDTCVDVLYQKIPEKARGSVRTLFRVIMICFDLLLVWFGIPFAVQGLGRRLVTVPLKVFWIRLAIPVGCGFMILMLILRIVIDTMGAKANQSADGKEAGKE